LHRAPSEVVTGDIAREKPLFGPVQTPPVAQDFQQLCREHDIAILLALCVGKNYVAMAARRQWERTVAPFGGNITFACGSSELSQESDKPRIGMPGLGRDVVWQIAE